MRHIQIVEVGPRDGLQNEPDIVSTADKLAMVGAMIDAGVRRLEVASFVHPQRVPQMADAEAVIAGLPDRDDVSYIGLTLNKRGVLRALATREGGRRGVDEIGCVIVATDTFGQKNQGQTVAEGIAEASEMIRFAKAEGLVAQVTISAAFGCPFEGDVPPQRIVDIAKAVLEAGPAEIALADTIGVGVPAQVTDLYGRLREFVPTDVRLRAHFHNTRGTGIANAWAAIQAGVTTLDASLGGLGGCPFAPKATGNIATEDLIYLAQQSGIEHGMDLDAVIAANRCMAEVLGRELPSLVARAAA
ncbi:MAG: hydroxymethylglutaryl-CoA lyase [Blastomonas fulva]|jgi:hydroxymethylglutaryl-CoA lyase|uniref:Hydroxymethylglutaryl-CoA lyase n=1 Tax=Blastomonas fulva TaxID=1550728 RepID=A0ABM6M3Q1_9SPHN|nr:MULTISPECIES: hydroxymethylglutaryl-CoA lyase [Blastomonas]AOF99393.1 HMGL-like family protein [Blastomonas sp. RAC04]ASR50529.1 hydroxymethylglutaryl-CoA lyase [Blastomonas fulva]KPF75962.1 3-hydroxy-3-methylglutaryl-CoA lyase [Blastomonas sp. AAP25]MDK2758483.1 hydroxymethylglutaryl-CoA lyase [Blastomonas fulva]MDM7927513.1 hydroxymethylglutaryl-CoA lyase [Blastomonas fulva]